MDNGHAAVHLPRRGLVAHAARSQSRPRMNNDMQTPFAIAIVMATVVRPSLTQAIRSIYAQRFDGRVQILVGIDRWEGERAMVDALLAECPAHMAVTLLDLGYSTSQRHGGVYPSHFGGAHICAAPLRRERQRRPAVSRYVGIHGARPGRICASAGWIRRHQLLLYRRAAVRRRVSGVGDDAIRGRHRWRSPDPAAAAPPAMGYQWRTYCLLQATARRPASLSAVAVPSCRRGPVAIPAGRGHSGRSGVAGIRRDRPGP